MLTGPNIEATRRLADAIRIPVIASGGITSIDDVRALASIAEPGIVGVMEVVREGYPDHTAFDPNETYYDPKSDPEKPRWYMVDIKFERKLKRTITLEELRQHAALADMPLLRKGNRLSIMPVSNYEGGNGSGDAKRVNQPTDLELMIAVQQGEVGQMGTLFERHHARIYNFCHRMTGSQAASEDLVQEAFIRVTRHLHRFDTTKKFSTWVYTIASNLSKNELRNRSRSPLVLFQKLQNSFDDDQRPLQFEDSSMRPDDMYRKRYGDDWMSDTTRQFIRFAEEHGYHPVSLAVAWVSHHPAVTAPILGARNVDQLEDALRSTDIQLSPELYADICRLTPTPPSATDRSEELIT